MEYKVARTELINPDVNSPEWDKAETGVIDKEMWSGLCKAPNTTFKLLRGPEGISVLMHTDEKNLRAEVKEQNGEICEDSCMEFFFKPSPWDSRYLNFEVNPDGIMHLGIGKDRFDRVLIFEDRKTFDIVSVAKDGDWTLKYYIPDSFLKKCFSDAGKAANGNTSTVAHGNFYKCGELTDHPHLAAWSEVEVAEGDFHLSDFFGKIRF